MKIRLTKLKESDNPLHPNNIVVGHIVERNVFRTHNSIYKWEIIKDD